MSNRKQHSAGDELQPEPTPVKDLPYFDSLRIMLEPYKPAGSLAMATHTYSTGELIASLEQHHGVPQGLTQGVPVQWVLPTDFVRAMHHLGYREENAGGVNLEWGMVRG